MFAIGVIGPGTTSSRRANWRSCLGWRPRAGRHGYAAMSEVLGVRLFAVFPALWTVVAVDGVDPTNNNAGRVQRLAVLWRRRPFGCHSTAGCRFPERILTVGQSLRPQRRCVVEFPPVALIVH